ncbi:secreted RxLR effector protein 78-like [Lotus japonicus]|uniref:secreted RxLR effector protein 78-like n=1 Tax=Lotus japonicus TaxID=34305 RepID=UPI0025899336|nr:secreted RxLR effector protein 78-like [Lotus japonicus]
MVDEFWQRGVWPKGSNASFIALIPKVDAPQNLNDFRPISLIGCMYKVISKLLAIRLKKVMGKLISEQQFAFLGGRQMLDSVVVVNEAIKAAKRAKKPTICFKVDYEKAYDSVRWDFLLYMMGRMNFCRKWINWIKSCLCSATVSVLVNGSPGEEFNMEKGLRQGDPLAPFLFLIVAEGLNRLFLYIKHRKSMSKNAL